MKMKIIMASLVGLTLGVTGVASAKPNSYFPPERINCQLSSNGKVSCNEFNRSYLTEDSTNAQLESGRDDIFNFVTAAAYVSRSQTEGAVFFTYKDSQSHVVKLRTINNMIRPDLEHGSWKQLNDEIYTCDAGYMNCPITHLPQN